MKHKRKRFCVVYCTPGYQLYCPQNYKLVHGGREQTSVTFIFYLTESVTFGDVSYLVANFFTFKDRRVSISFFASGQRRDRSIFILLFSILTLFKNLVFYLVGCCKFTNTLPVRLFEHWFGFGQSCPEIGDANSKCAL